jgi:hypothetical protein
LKQNEQLQIYEEEDHDSKEKMLQSLKEIENINYHPKYLTRRRKKDRRSGENPSKGKGIKL